MFTKKVLLRIKRALSLTISTVFLVPQNVVLLANTNTYLPNVNTIVESISTLSTMGSNLRNFNMTPGAVVSEMRFTWHSGHENMQLNITAPNGEVRNITSTGRELLAHAGIGAMGVTNNLIPTREGFVYFVHQVAVYDLTPDTTYTYQILANGFTSNINTFRTGGRNNFSFIIAGDPQIGTGDGLDATGTVEATIDGMRWQSALNLAVNSVPHADFILSMGDQVQTSAVNNSNINQHVHISQYRHDRMFSPSVFSNIPLLPIVGNHDGWTQPQPYLNNNANTRLWNMHYNLPASNTPGQISGRFSNIFRHSDSLYTQFDYWVRWGDVFFYIYDSNGSNGTPRTMSGARLDFLENAVSQNSDAKWFVALWHHPAYSVYRMPGIPEKQQLINNVVPHFERLGFDIILNGHAHSYSRTHHMQGTNTVLSQRWLDSNANIMYGEEPTNAVLDPIGIVHIDFNSMSGSGFYNVAAMPRREISVYNQNFLRNFSVVDVTDDTFSVRTYQINNDYSRTLVDIYTIVRSQNGSVPSSVTSLPQMGYQIFQRITIPEEIITTVTDIFEDLPETVGIETNLFNNVDGDTRQVRPPNAAAAPYSYGLVVRTPRAYVEWDIEGSDFDPEYTGIQDITIIGNVTELPNNILNISNIPQTTTINIRVMPADFVMPGYIARFMQYAGTPPNPDPSFGLEAYFHWQAGGRTNNATAAQLAAVRVPYLPVTYGNAEPIRFLVGGVPRMFNWNSGAPTIINAASTAMGGLNNLTQPAYWTTSFSTLGRAAIEVEFNFRSDPAGTGANNNGPRDWQFEMSLDGINYLPVGLPITLTGFWNNNIVRQLPELANDQEVVYVRWRKTSQIAVGGGEISATARNHMRDIRIRSTRPLIDDGSFDSAQRIDVLMFNDFHGHVETGEPVPENPGAARLAAFIQYQRYQNPNPNNVIVVTGGDEFHGYAVSTLTQGNPSLALMGYLAENSPAQRESGIHTALGNHEFSFGPQRARDFGNDPRVTLLAADLFNAPNVPGERPDFVRPYDIVSFPDHDITVALVGLMTSNMQSVVSGWGTLGFEARTPAPNNPREYTVAMQNLISYLREERGVGAVIGVTHMGGNSASMTYIAQNLDFDGIVGGHVHVRVHRNVADTPIIEAQHHGRALGRFSLIFDENGDLTRVDSWLSEVGAIENFTRNAAVVFGVEHHYDNVTNLIMPYINQTYTELRGPRGPHGIYFSNRAERDVWSSRLVLDYVTRWAEVNGYQNESFVAISNGGGWRNTGFWPRSANQNTNMAELLSTMPFDNNILIFRMHGVDLLSLINISGLTGHQVRAGLYHYDGNWYVTDTNERIRADRSQVFNVIANNFIFGGIGEVGGDNYPLPGNQRGNQLGMQVLDPNGPRVVMQNGMPSISWTELLEMSTASVDWEELGVSMIRTALLASTEYRQITPNNVWQAELRVSSTNGGTAAISSPFAPNDRTRNTNIIPQWVTVNATPQQGYEFVGWFNHTDTERENPVSTEVNFGFVIRENTHIVAHFENAETMNNYISVSEARATNIGETVTVRGIATAVYSTNATNNNSFFLQDATGETNTDGILVMLTATNTAANPSANNFIGHYVEVTGVRQLPTNLANGFNGVDNINTGIDGSVRIIEENVSLPSPVVVNNLSDLVVLNGTSRPFSSMIVSINEPVQIYSLTTTGPGNTPIRAESWSEQGSGAMNGNNPLGPPRFNTNSAIINATNISDFGLQSGDWVYIDRAVVHWWNARNEIQLRLLPNDTTAIRRHTPEVIPPNIELLTISEANSRPASDDIIKLRGYVTNVQAGNLTNRVFLQDSQELNSAIMLFATDNVRSGDLAQFVGQWVEVTGFRTTWTTHSIQPQFTVQTINVLENQPNPILPMPITDVLQLRNTGMQGMYVSFENVLLASTNATVGLNNNILGIENSNVHLRFNLNGIANSGDYLNISRAAVHWRGNNYTGNFEVWIIANSTDITINKPIEPEIPEVIEPIEPEVPEVIEPIEPEVPEVIEPVEPEVPEVIEPINPEVPEVIEPVEPEIPEVIEPVEPEVPEVIEPINPEVPEVIEPIEPEVPIVIPPVTTNPPTSTPQIPVTPSLPQATQNTQVVQTEQEQTEYPESLILTGEEIRNLISLENRIELQHENIIVIISSEYIEYLLQVYNENFEIEIKIIESDYILSFEVNIYSNGETIRITKPFTIIANIEIPMGINTYRLVAMQNISYTRYNRFTYKYRNLLGGRYENGLFRLETTALGRYDIEYVENLNRVMLSINNITMIDLAQNNRINSDIAPIIVNNLTHIPLRALSDMLGIDINWNADTGKVSLLNLSFIPDLIIEDRTMVPLRFASESLGAIVTWFPETAQVEVIYIGQVR
ncbi:MAG: metallophosphoesterase [Defluviitaleaceae bacterium]|nr:metallophosphoesterase [Defluviitaleaceae bacterium]